MMGDRKHGETMRGRWGWGGGQLMAAEDLDSAAEIPGVEEVQELSDVSCQVCAAKWKGKIHNHTVSGSSSVKLVEPIP